MGTKKNHLQKPYPQKESLKLKLTKKMTPIQKNKAILQNGLKAEVQKEELNLTTSQTSLQDLSTPPKILNPFPLIFCLHSAAREPQMFHKIQLTQS